MSTDRELLELAAKAAGYNVQIFGAGHSDATYGIWHPGTALTPVWNPLTDDGDEARLEATLDLDLAWWTGRVCVGGQVELYVNHGGDKQAARRRAGVRAAAEIGRAMP